MEGNNQITKIAACSECYNHPYERDRCICWTESEYPTIEIEFKQCRCCGNVDFENIPFTKFNREQLGDTYFKEEIEEEKLQKRIYQFTYEIESFRTSGDVTKCESAVRVTCIETGKVVECSTYRSKSQNIEQAKRMLNEH